MDAKPPMLNLIRHKTHFLLEVGGMEEGSVKMAGVGEGAVEVVGAGREEGVEEMGEHVKNYVNTVQFSGI